MQLSLRSQMIAGTTAVLGATAIAMTPVAPAVQLPSLSPTKAAVALTAFNNPINEILLSANLAVGYLLDSTVVEPGVDWVSSGIDPIGLLNGVPPISPNPAVPGLLPYLGVLNVGVVPNFLANPLPALTQLTSNWLGYTQDAVGAGGAIAGAVSTLAWLPVSLGVTIFEDVISGNIPAIAGDIQAAINAAFTQVNLALTAASTAAQSIVNGIFTNGAAVIQAVTGQLPALLGVITGSFNALSLTLQNVGGAVSAGFAADGISGGWNAAIKGLLGVSPDGSYGENGFTLPGTLINLTVGAGMQIGPITDEATAATNFVPSLRTVATGFTNTIAEALGAPAPAPSPLAGASVRAGAARAAAADSATAASSDSGSKPAAGHRGGARAAASKAKAAR